MTQEQKLELRPCDKKECGCIPSLLFLPKPLRDELPQAVCRCGIYITLPLKDIEKMLIELWNKSNTRTEAQNDKTNQ